MTDATDQTADKRLPAAALMDAKTDVKPPETAPEPAHDAPVEEPEPTAKERIQAIAQALTSASPSGVEALAGELAALAEAL